jgi:hypothetical protein
VFAPASGVNATAGVIATFDEVGQKDRMPEQSALKAGQIQSATII